MRTHEQHNTKENDMAVHAWPQSGFAAPGKQQLSDAAAEARPHNPRRAALADRNNRTTTGPSAPAAVPMFIRGARLAVVPSDDETRRGEPLEEQVKTDRQIDYWKLDPLYYYPFGNSSSSVSARVATAAAGSSAPAAAPTLFSCDSVSLRKRQLAVEKELRAAFAAAAMSNAAAARKAAAEQAAAEQAAAEQAAEEDLASAARRLVFSPPSSSVHAIRRLDLGPLDLQRDRQLPSGSRSAPRQLPRNSPAPPRVAAAWARARRA